VYEVIRYILFRLKKDEHGAELVEFAIVALLFFILIFGIINFGWIFHGYITLTGAAREGARMAVVMKNDDQAAIKSVVKEHARIFNLEDANIVISPANFDEERKITVTGDLDLLVVIPPFLNSITLKSSATMRQEQ
jgi:Flp pilus assembly protein TadG